MVHGRTRRAVRVHGHQGQYACVNPVAILLPEGLTNPDGEHSSLARSSVDTPYGLGILDEEHHGSTRVSTHCLIRRSDS